MDQTQTRTQPSRASSFLRRLWPRSIRSRVLIVALASIAVITVVPIVDEVREREQAEDDARDSIPSASRRVVRLTLKVSASSRSEGSLSPGPSCRFAISSTTLSRAPSTADTASG